MRQIVAGHSLQRMSSIKPGKGNLWYVVGQALACKYVRGPRL